jgi:hypothetical protein
MSEVNEVLEPHQPEEDKVPLSPFDYLKAKYPTAPSEAIIQSYKSQVPGGRVRLFELPDGKRAVLLRGLSPLELAAIQADVAKLDQTKQLAELQFAVASKCTLWASFTKGGKLLDNDLRQAGAGLAVTLHAVIWDLSDYIDPAVIDNLIIDL